MKPGEFRYFLAIIPPIEVAQEIYEIKEEVAEKFNSKAALRSPAHITLHMPFSWKEAKEDKLIGKLAQATNFESFNLTFNGYAVFPPRTIYIKNEYSQYLMYFQLELAQFCKKELNLFNSTHNRGFNPHTTIAFRDLRNDNFQRAWDYFKNRTYQNRFEVSGFWLLKHDGKRWKAHHEFKFLGFQQVPEL